MEYIGHTDGERVQLLQDHLDGTAELAGQFAAPMGLEVLGRAFGKNHDIGKYGSLFQEYIRGQKKRGGDHSTAGARYFWDCRKAVGPASLMGAFCISGHHCGLLNRGSKVSSADEPTFLGRMKKEIPEYIAISAHGSMDRDLLRADLNRFGLAPIDRMMLIRMLFSCLVDADFLDTENFMSQGTRKRGGFASIADLHDRFFKELSKRGYLNPTSPINKRRSQILLTCLEKGKG